MLAFVTFRYILLTLTLRAFQAAPFVPERR